MNITVEELSDTIVDHPSNGNINTVISSTKSGLLLDRIKVK